MLLLRLIVGIGDVCLWIGERCYRYVERRLRGDTLLSPGFDKL